MKILVSLMGLLIFWGVITGQLVKIQSSIDYIAILLFSIFLIILPILDKINNSFKSIFATLFLIFLAAAVPEPSYLLLAVLFSYVCVHFIAMRISNRTAFFPALLPTIMYIMGVHFLYKSSSVVVILFTGVVFITIWLLPYINYSLSKYINQRIWNVPTNPLIISIPILGYFLAPRLHYYVIGTMIIIVSYIILLTSSFYQFSLQNKKPRI